MSSTAAASTEVCDGENLAIILALYWVVYLIINAVIFAAVMYALRKCFAKESASDQTKTNKVRSPPSRTSSRRSLVSSGMY